MTITVRTPSGSASSSRKRASSEPRPGSTAWTRPPAATRRPPGPGSGRPPSGRTVSQSHRPRPGRSAAAAAVPAVAQVGHAEPHAVDGDDLVERARRRSLRPWCEDDHAVAHPLDLGQQVRVEDHRGAAVAGRADDRPHVGPTDRVERRRRLVEEDEVRLAEQRDAEPEPLLHALREAR